MSDTTDKKTNTPAETPDKLEGQQAAATPPATAPDAPVDTGAGQTPAATPSSGTATPAASKKAAKKTAAPKEPKAPKPAKAAAAPPAGGFTIDRVLKVTKPLVKGDDVKVVQAALIAKGFHCGIGGANGVYGAETALAVRHFQAMNRLIVSGRVEKFTASALGAEWKEPPSGTK